MEHAGIINDIVEVERTAHRMSDEAYRKQAALEGELKIEREKIRRNYLERANRRLKIISDQREQEAKEAVAALDRELKDNLDAVDRLRRENFDRWVDTLFTRIVGE